MTQDSAPPPLADVRVLEMGQLLAGPFCGQLLGDFGAEVIKLEDPVRGDPMREWGHIRPNGLSLWWPILARNKKSVTCNLRTARGQDLVRRIVPHIDVIVENFRPGTLERWGLGYDVLSRLNPGLILVRVTGYGQDGPYAQRASYGSIGEAMGGIRHITGSPDRPPSRTGISLGDSLGGTFAAVGALVALHARRRTGQGQVVDAAIYEAVLALMESTVPEFTVAGHIRERTGSTLANIAPSNVYPTLDGQMLLVAANQDTVFGRLVTAMGKPALAQDPRFATHGARGENQQELDDLITEWTSGQDAEALLHLLDEHAVPAGQIYTAREMLADPQFIARQSIVTVDHPVLGPLPMSGVVPRLSETPGVIRHLGPSLGEHNRDIYQVLAGLTDLELAELKADAVI
jgi:succinyl-CoA---D-citramalate CoA-transferase